MTITIVSWNINRGRVDAVLSPWTYMKDELGADVVLVQEAPRPPADWSSVGAVIGGTRRWGTWVASPHHPLIEVTEVREPRTAEPRPYGAWRPGTSATATAVIHNKPLTFVSLYGLMEPQTAYASMNGHLAELAPLLDSPDHFRQVVVGGDFNLTSQWSGTNHSYAAIDRALLSQFRAWGLRDLTAESVHDRMRGCTCDEGEACRHVQTWWRAGDDTPRQNDYLFVASRMTGTITFRVDPHETMARSISDHAALVATIDNV